MPTTDLRQRLVELLLDSHAHVSLLDAVAAAPADVEAARPAGLPHSLWQLVEHVRISQRHLLDLCRVPGYRFPRDEAAWWPVAIVPPTPSSFSRAVADFASDLKSFAALVADPATDLHARIAGTGDRSVLRQALVLAGHTAYHTGQIVMIRQLLGAWPSGETGVELALPRGGDSEGTDETDVRARTIELLRGSPAHVSFEVAIEGFPTARCGERPSGIEHSAWDLVEHLRIAQRDILDWSRGPEPAPPPFPAGYWPAADRVPTAAEWPASVAAFLADRAEIEAWIEDSESDLWSPFPWGSGGSLLGQALLAADHNAYHLGQLVLVRRLLGDWRGR